MSTFNQTVNTIAPVRKATVSDFNRAKTKGYFRKIIAILTGHSNRLEDLKILLREGDIRSRHSIGTRTVRIDQIKGSEGRNHDFDQDFNPLKSHNRDRWLNVARAWLTGVYLPAVELIKVNDIYFVRDGHHRISVAHYMGSDFIDAHVTEWVLAN